MTRAPASKITTPQRNPGNTPPRGRRTQRNDGRLGPTVRYGYCVQELQYSLQPQIGLAPKEGRGAIENRAIGPADTAQRELASR